MTDTYWCFKATTCVSCALDIMFLFSVSQRLSSTFCLFNEPYINSRWQCVLCVFFRAIFKVTSFLVLCIKSKSHHLRGKTQISIFFRTMVWCLVVLARASEYPYSGWVLKLLGSLILRMPLKIPVASILSTREWYEKFTTPASQYIKN